METIWLPRKDIDHLQTGACRVTHILGYEWLLQRQRNGQGHGEPPWRLGGGVGKRHAEGHTGREGGAAGHELSCLERRKANESRGQGKTPAEGTWDHLQKYG